MSSWDDSIQVASSPDIDISGQSSGVCCVIRSKCQTHDGLDFSGLSEHSFLGSKGIPTQRPELDVFHATADQRILSIGIKLDIKHLPREIKLNKYTVLTIWSLKCSCVYMYIISVLEFHH